MVEHEEHNADRAARWLSPDRERELDPFNVINYMPIDPYDRVADIGCGPGYFTIPLAKYLVHGFLHALDTDEEMVEVTRRRVEASRLGHVQVQACQPTEFPIEAGSLDGVFLSLVVHHHGLDREAFLKAVRELLRPRGWCIVLEWHGEGGQDSHSHDHRIEPDDLRGLAQRSGFRFQGWRKLNDAQYMATLRK